MTIALIKMSFSLKIAVVITTSNVLLLCLSTLLDLKNETNIMSVVDLIKTLYLLLFCENRVDLKKPADQDPHCFFDHMMNLHK